jgi:hypothetical protein
MAIGQRAVALGLFLGGRSLRHPALFHDGSCSASDQTPSVIRCCLSRAMGSPNGKRAASLAGRYLLGSSEVECGTGAVGHPFDQGRARGCGGHAPAPIARRHRPPESRCHRHAATQCRCPRRARQRSCPHRPAMAWKVEMAHWLLTTFRITGARYTWAKVTPVWKSASAVAPSPIQADAILVSPLMRRPWPSPPPGCTAWPGCPRSRRSRRACYEYITGSWRPLSGSFWLLRTAGRSCPPWPRRRAHSSRPCWR